MSFPERGTTLDAVLGGRVKLRQPSRGHRAGTDALLLAASCPAGAGDRIADLGAGVGTAGLCVLARVRGSFAVLVERDAELAGLAAENTRLNGQADQVTVSAHAIGEDSVADDMRQSVDHVLANPPFNDAAGFRSTGDKASAHLSTDDTLDMWMRHAAAILRSKGTLALIHRPKALAGILAALENRFGDVRLKPVQPRPDTPAARILVRAVKGSRAPVQLLSPLVLHGAAGSAYTDEANAVLGDGAALDFQ